MTGAELLGLLRDCQVLWAVDAQISADDSGGVTLTTAEGAFVVSPAGEHLRPVRWFLQTPDRQAAGRSARALPSVVALLSALRNQLGATGGVLPRFGSAGPA